MSRDAMRPGLPGFAGGSIPGTSARSHSDASKGSQDGRSAPRDGRLRRWYLDAALAEIPRLLGAIDRHPFHPTYGCLDRQYWHYRTASFPSEMYQEGVLPLAMVYAMKLPGNRWYRQERIRELVIAGLRFNQRAGRRDGSCDDYYPYERALGAAVFSLQATARAYQLLELSDAELVDWFRRRADWLIRNDESGRLANHHALAALGLLRVAEITGESGYREAADARVQRVLGWQDEEGWFEEYGGADPGYQTVTIDCLAQYRTITGQRRLDDPLRQAVCFSRMFLHPDNSYAGPYGSRGTLHFYPHGMELLAPDSVEAAELADGFLRSLATGTHARLDDDRMFVHRLASLIGAYVDWAPASPPATRPETSESTRYLPRAQILVRKGPGRHTTISAARGGVFRHFATVTTSVTDAGLVVQTEGGRVAVSHWHDRSRDVELLSAEGGRVEGLVTRGSLYWHRHETATPLKQALLNVGMWTLGRWCRTLVRRVFQRRLITGRRFCPIRLTRKFEFLAEREMLGGSGLRVTDTIELVSPRVRVQKMAYGTDHESAYVAASGFYQEAVLEPWTDLASRVAELNAHRRVTIVREL